MNISSPSRAVLTLSGGIDSLTITALAMDRGRECHAITFDYGQRHAQELACARAIADHYGIPLHVVKIDHSLFDGCPLTSNTPLASDRSLDEIASGVSPNWMPARNTIFLSYALALAEILEAEEIYFGSNADDGSFPDCSPEYVAAWQPLAALATKPGAEGQPTRIVAPLQAMKKEDVITTAAQLSAPLHLTSSCYQPPETGVHCGRCDACQIRKKGFTLSGLSDPSVYRE